MGNFLVRYASRVVIYDRRAVIRLPQILTKRERERERERKKERKKERKDTTLKEELDYLMCSNCSQIAVESQLLYSSTNENRLDLGPLLFCRDSGGRFSRN